MKTLIILSLIIAVTTAFSLPDFNLGLNEQFKFSDSQVQDGSRCLESIQTATGNQISALIKTLQDQGVQQFANDIHDVIPRIKFDVQHTCMPYMRDFFFYSMLHAHVQDIRANVETFYPEIIQWIIRSGYYALGNADEEAGKAAASAVQLVIGSAKPDVLKYAAIDVDLNITANSTNIILPFNFTTSTIFAQFFQGYFDTFGYGQVTTVEDLIACFNQVQVNNVQLGLLIAQMSLWDHDQKVSAMKSFLDDATANITNSCNDGFQSFLLILDPLGQNLYKDPINFLFQAFNNAVTNSADIVELVQQLVLDVISHDFQRAGQDIAQMLFPIFDGLVDFGMLQKTIVA